MTREEAIQRGITPEETQHHHKRRAVWHDYRHRGLYMLTLTITERQPLLGSVNDDATFSPSPLGKKILAEEVQKISAHYPMVQVWKTVLMPDHLHMLLYVSDDLPEGKTLGTVVRGFKTGCSRAWWAEGTKVPREAAMPRVSPRGNNPLLFEQGYNDRIIKREGMLEKIKAYMDENPRRYIIRRHHPDIMQRCLHLRIGNHDFAAFGNIFLLKYPLRQQVFFHRKDKTTGMPYETTAAYQKEKTRILRNAEEGVVLVTPGISKGEQIIKNEAIEKGLPLIHLQKEPITEYWKPEKSRFYACAGGSLLILYPYPSGKTKGTTAKGTTAEGTTAKGTTAEGTTAEGTTAEGTTAEGTTVSDYTSFHNLNDIAAYITQQTGEIILKKARQSASGIAPR